MKVSISRSVGRTFAVIEIFRETRQPASATQLRRLLDAPHSSVVAVLQNLRELGYLSFDASNMTYFPTRKLLDLTGWLRPEPQERGLPNHARLGGLAERVSRDTRQMTSVSSRLSLFINTVVLHPGRFAVVSAPARSVGGALTSSASGLVILAQLDDSQVRDILRDTEAWLHDAGVRKTTDMRSTLAGIETVRRQGYLAGAHPTCRNTEIIAYPIKASDAPVALSVHIPAFLAQDGKAEVRQLVQARIREFEAAPGRLPASVPTLPVGQAVRRPAARPQDFGARVG